MKPEETAWPRLVAAARLAKDDRETAAPYGFATRVAAIAMASDRLSTAALFDRLSWRALGLAGLLALGSVAFNYPALAAPAPEEDVFTEEVLVTELFDVS